MKTEVKQDLMRTTKKFRTGFTKMVQAYANHLNKESFVVAYPETYVQAKDVFAAIESNDMLCEQCFIHPSLIKYRLKDISI